jgi:hypothetical protein
MSQSGCVMWDIFRATLYKCLFTSCQDHIPRPSFCSTQNSYKIIKGNQDDIFDGQILSICEAQSGPYWHNLRYPSLGPGKVDYEVLLTGTW